MKSLMFLFMLLFPIAGVITGNILGTYKNKTANMVFFVWKGIQVFRQHVFPAQPRTVPQVLQRNKFTAVLRVAQQLLLSVIQPFWKPYAIHQSEYNAFMSDNLNVVAYPLVYSTLILAKGNLEDTAIIAVTYAVIDGRVSIVYSPDLSGTQKVTDLAFAAVYDPNRTAWFVNVSGMDLRGDEVIIVTTVPGYAGVEITSMTAYLWFSDVLPSEGSFVCSNSVNNAVADGA